MNSLAEIDQKLLEAIKKKIELASGLENKTEWVQKDYDFLAFFIEDETGIRLSLSTVKRIWRNEFNRLPHISTLDTLSKLAYKKNWKTIKKQWLEQEHKKYKPNKKSKNLNIYLISLLATALIIAFGIFMFSREHKISLDDKENITFHYKKSVQDTIPNTVVFYYNIESIEADRFFLQQSWDKSRKVEIYKNNTQQTDIYYIPGYFNAKLFADKEIVKEIPVHITYKDWFIAARQPMSNIKSFGKKYWLKKPYLGVDKTSLQSKKIDLNENFQLAFYYVKDFKLDGDNFYYTTMLKMESLEDFSCSKASLHIQAENGYYWIMLGNKGCESELAMRFGEKNYIGKNYDLTKFGTNIYQWQKVELDVLDKKVTISINGKIIFSDNYENSLGAIKEVSYFFDGIGVIDNVELKNTNGKVIFSDDFE